MRSTAASASSRSMVAWQASRPDERRNHHLDRVVVQLDRDPLSLRLLGAQHRPPRSARRRRSLVSSARWVFEGTVARDLGVAPALALGGQQPLALDRVPHRAGDQIARDPSFDQVVARAHPRARRAASSSSPPARTTMGRASAPARSAESVSSPRLSGRLRSTTTASVAAAPRWSRAASSRSTVATSNAGSSSRSWCCSTPAAT